MKSGCPPAWSLWEDWLCCLYSGLTLNQYGVASPCVLFVLSAASSPCPDLKLIHYILAVSQPATASAYTQLRNKAAMTKKGRLKPKFWVSDDLFAWRIYPIAVIFSAVELAAGNALFISICCFSMTWRMSAAAMFRR